MSLRRVDIVVPCYNPPHDWAAGLVAAWQELASALATEAELSLILVNDGSRLPLPAGDLALLQAHIPRMRLHSYTRNQGKGHALREGMRLAQGELQLYTDIDFPYTTASAVAVYRALAHGGADVAAGVRDSGYYAHVPFLRRVISKLLRWMLARFMRIQISDTQCGLKGFNATGKSVFLETKIQRFLFDLEFIFLASNTPQLQLTPVPVQLRPDITFSKARLGILLRESWNFAGILMRSIGKARR